MNKHTPGPWLVTDGPRDYQHRVFNANVGGDTVCDVIASRDARLIAAAPELLEALNAAHMALIDYLPAHRNAVTDAAIAQAVAAIAKATGAPPHDPH